MLKKKEKYFFLCISESFILKPLSLHNLWQCFSMHVDKANYNELIALSKTALLNAFRIKISY